MASFSFFSAFGISEGSGGASTYGPPEVRTSRTLHTGKQSTTHLIASHRDHDGRSLPERYHARAVSLSALESVLSDLHGYVLV